MIAVAPSGPPAPAPPPPADAGAREEAPAPGCSKDGWCRLAAPETAASQLAPRGVWVFGSTEIFGYADQGSILRWDGSAWTETYRPKEPYPTAIWGSAPDDVWAAVSGATLARFDGKSWQRRDLGKNNLRAIWGTSRQRVWVASDDGVVHAFDGSRFRAQTIASSMTVYAGHGTAPDHIVLAGPDGLAVWDGKRATREPAPVDPEYGKMGLLCVWTAGPDFAVAGGYGGALLRWDGSRWAREAIPFKYKVWAVWGTGKSDVFAVGETGAIFHYDGQAWTREDSGTSENIFSVHGTASEVVVSTAGGVLLKKRP